MAEQERNWSSMEDLLSDPTVSALFKDANVQAMEACQEVLDEQAVAQADGYQGDEALDVAVNRASSQTRGTVEFPPAVISDSDKSFNAAMAEKFGGVYSGDTSETASEDDIKELFDEEEEKEEPSGKKSLFDAFKSESKKSEPSKEAGMPEGKAYTGKKFFETKKAVFEDTKTSAQAESQVLYDSQSIQIGGKVVELRQATRSFESIPGFGGSDDLEGNFKAVVDFITAQVRKDFGGWDKVRSIAVSGDYLIINRIMYTPEFGLNHDKYTQSLPIDLSGLFDESAYARFFNWAKLGQMVNLSSLSFDDASFFAQEIAPYFSARKTSEIEMLFKRMPRMQELVLGSDVITRSELEGGSKDLKAGGSGGNVMKVVRKEKLRNRLLTGFKLDVVGGSDSIRSFTSDSLKNYAKNRGDKGLLRYGGGILARSGLAFAGLVQNFGCHLIRNIKNIVTGNEETVPVDLDKG